MVHTQSAVTTTELIEKFGVSIETIRKDLILLEKSNELDRVHGGAVIKATAGHWLDLSKRINANKSEKAELSSLAMELLNEGDTIAVDSGSTALEFSEMLKERFNSLTIVTHSMDVFNKIHSHKDFNVILCGGYFLSDENAFYGAFTIKMLEDIHVGKVFILPSAVSIKNGICDYQPLLFEIQKKLITVGDEIIVMADSSKYEKNALLKICSINEKYVYISDSALPEKIKEIYRNNNINIITNKDEIR
jgi:DeoR/GlpR family transcriptional regulator of sugar metabolism